MTSSRWRRGPTRQWGVYAIEFAIIFPVFFVLMYGALAFSTIAFMRLNLQHAAEDGARAALSYQTALGTRLAQAVTVTQSRTSWMPGPRSIVADLCVIGSECNPASTPASPGASCGETIGDACQIVVVARYDYAAHPIFPAIPGLGFLLPDQLHARASVLADAVTLNPLGNP